MRAEYSSLDELFLWWQSQYEIYFVFKVLFSIEVKQSLFPDIYCINEFVINSTNIV